ncbi:MAG: hypothetical protein IPK19_17685 [Chloroflexi bacterium]|nr:hypothetical protein [Chloroflexota bacterium]
MGEVDEAGMESSLTLPPLSPNEIRWYGHEVAWAYVAWQLDPAIELRPVEPLMVERICRPRAQS